MKKCPNCSRYYSNHYEKCPECKEILFYVNEEKVPYSATNKPTFKGEIAVLILLLSLILLVSGLSIYTHIDRESDYVISEGVLIKYKGYMSEVTIPEGVIEIGENAFYNVDTMKTLIITEGVLKINSNAFSNCDALSNVTISSTVMEIGETPFDCCPYLFFIEVDSRNSVFDSRNNCNAIIETATNKLLIGCTKTIIPDTVTSIGKYAFKEIDTLEEVIIPNSVTEIDHDAFYNNANIKSVTLSSGIKEVDDWFAWTYNLRTVIIPEGVTTIKKDAFSLCRKLKDVKLPSTITSIEEYAFCYCRSLTNISYSGSKDQWREIKFGIDWDDTTGDYIVNCLDGKIYKNYSN